MIDIDAILTSVIKICRSAVGDSLSTLGGGSLASVIRTEENGVIPKYPYITVDYVQTLDVDGWATDYSVDQNGFSVYSTDKLLILRLTCFGEDGNQIIQKLISKLRFDTYRNRLREETGAAFVEESDVGQIPQLKGVKWIENGFVDITLSAIDTDTDAESTTIDTVGVVGTVEDVEGNVVVTVSINTP